MLATVKVSGKFLGEINGWRDRWPFEYDAPIIPMNQIYYNFIRPNRGLDGKWPAEATRVGIEEENKWIGFIKRSIENKSI